MNGGSVGSFTSKFQFVDASFPLFFTYILIAPLLFAYSILLSVNSPSSSIKPVAITFVSKSVVPLNKTT